MSGEPTDAAKTGAGAGLGRDLAAGAASVLLLLVGAALVIALVFAVAALGGGVSDVGRASVVAKIYYKVVVVKGLLPQLVLTLLLHPLVRRLRVRWATVATREEALSPSRGALLLELLVVSALAYTAVAPWLLTMDYEGWPALTMTTDAQQITTFVGMSATCALAAWLPRLVLDGRSHAPGDAGSADRP